MANNPPDQHSGLTTNNNTQVHQGYEAYGNFQSTQYNQQDGEKEATQNSGFVTNNGSQVIQGYEGYNNHQSSQYNQQDGQATAMETLAQLPSFGATSEPQANLTYGNDSSVQQSQFTLQDHSSMPKQSSDQQSTLTTTNYSPAQYHQLSQGQSTTYNKPPPPYPHQYPQYTQLQKPQNYWSPQYASHGVQDQTQTPIWQSGSAQVNSYNVQSSEQGQSKWDYYPRFQQQWDGNKNPKTVPQTQTYGEAPSVQQPPSYNQTSSHQIAAQPLDKAQTTQNYYAPAQNNQHYDSYAQQNVTYALPSTSYSTNVAYCRPSVIYPQPQYPQTYSTTAALQIHQPASNQQCQTSHQQWPCVASTSQLQPSTSNYAYCQPGNNTSLNTNSTLPSSTVNYYWTDEASKMTAMAQTSTQREANKQTEITRAAAMQEKEDGKKLYFSEEIGQRIPLANDITLDASLKRATVHEYYTGGHMQQSQLFGSVDINAGGQRLNLGQFGMTVGNTGLTPQPAPLPALPLPNPYQGHLNPLCFDSDVMGLPRTLEILKAEEDVKLARKRVQVTQSRKAHAEIAIINHVNHVREKQRRQRSQRMSGQLRHIYMKYEYRGRETRAARNIINSTSSDGSDNVVNDLLQMELKEAQKACSEAKKINAAANQKYQAAVVAGVHRLAVEQSSQSTTNDLRNGNASQQRGQGRGRGSRTRGGRAAPIPQQNVPSTSQQSCLRPSVQNVPINHTNPLPTSRRHYQTRQSSSGGVQYATSSQPQASGGYLQPNAVQPVQPVTVQPVPNVWATQPPPRRQRGVQNPQYHGQYNGSYNPQVPTRQNYSNNSQPVGARRQNLLTVFPNQCAAHSKVSPTVQTPARSGVASTGEMRANRKSGPPVEVQPTRKSSRIENMPRKSYVDDTPQQVPLSSFPENADPGIDNLIATLPVIPRGVFQRCMDDIFRNKQPKKNEGKQPAGTQLNPPQAVQPQQCSAPMANSNMTSKIYVGTSGQPIPKAATSETSTAQSN